MKWLKKLLSILDKEPENWLAYLHGQQLKNIPHLKNTPPRFRGVVLTFLMFFYFLARNFSLFPRRSDRGQCTYYFFAGTHNQISSLDGLAGSLKEKGALIYGVATHEQISNEFRKNIYHPLRFCLLDVVKTLVLLFSRIQYLRKVIKQEYADVKGLCLGRFLVVYPHLVFFQRHLEEVKPEYVVLANDHSESNRCLLAVAHSLGIKTVYLQHASVSNLFPALRFSYAFLDGESALNTYRECEGNQPEKSANYPVPKVMLTGQKKLLHHRRSRDGNAVGIALNALDDVSSAVQLVEFLEKLGISVCVRWHPAQVDSDVADIKRAFSGRHNVKLSDPAKDTLSAYLLNISWLVAGNSSIHLEAALSGVKPIYYEVTPSGNSDYYGYVKHGLAIVAKSLDDVADFIKKNRHTPDPDPEAVRYYSATYLTEWEGKEGQLVAECLENIRYGVVPPVEILSLTP